MKRLMIKIIKYYYINHMSALLNLLTFGLYSQIIKIYQQLKILNFQLSEMDNKLDDIQADLDKIKDKFPSNYEAYGDTMTDNYLEQLKDISRQIPKEDDENSDKGILFYD